METYPPLAQPSSHLSDVLHFVLYAFSLDSAQHSPPDATEQLPIKQLYFSWTVCQLRGFLQHEIGMVLQRLIDEDAVISL